MNKKTSITVLLTFIAGAILLGALLVNKGDGPVTGIIMADRALENSDAYQEAQQAPGDGIYLVVNNAFNKFQEDYKASISENQTLYATVHFVECPKGSVFTAKWLLDGNLIQQTDETLLTGPEGVITYQLDGANVAKGSYVFELYDGENKIFEWAITVD